MNSPNKVAIVTGAGTRIGKAVAIAFCRRGIALHLPDDAKSCSSRLPRRQGQQAFGRLDVLFNNAGVSAPGVPLEELSYEQWQAVVDTNLTGAFLGTQEAFMIMKSQDRRGGRIINNGSISAHAPRPNSAPYTATKHAITGLTKSTALDGRKYDIACGQIDIGNALTELTANMAQEDHSGNRTTLPGARIDRGHPLFYCEFATSINSDEHLAPLLAIASPGVSPPA